MPIPRQRTAIPKLVGMVLFLVLVGCEHEHQFIRPLSPDESARIKAGDSAIVLLRFAVQDEKGTRLDPFARFEGTTHSEDFYGLPVGDFDSGGKPKRREVRILSVEARNQGWLMLNLPPGYYYLVIARAIFGPNYAESAPRWRIKVPRGAPVIYAGTFHLSATTAHELFDWHRISIAEIDDAATTVEDETEPAVQTARRDLPGLPPPVTRLAVLHTGPILLGVPPPARPPE